MARDLIDRRPLRRRVAAALSVTIALGALAVPLAGQDVKSILLLHSYGFDAPGRIPFDAAFARTLRETTDVKVDLFVETIDPNRFRGEAQAERTRDYLRARYADKNLAAVATGYDRALAFLLEGRQPLFPGVPVAAILTRYPESVPEHVSAIWSGASIGESTSLALKLHPRTRQIALIDAATPSAASDAVYAEALKQIEDAAPRIDVVSLRNLPLDELLSRVRTLPSDTAIVVARQLLGYRGEAISSPDAVREVAQVASVPVYVGADQLIGSGAVGGVVVSVESDARHLANVALRIARDGSLRVPVARGAPVPMFDWRQLRRWGIDESLLPAGSVVQFRQLSVWEQYKFYVWGAAAIVGIQAALIAGLVVQHARRRRSEAALRESEERFRLMANGAPVMVWTAKPNMATDFFNSTVLAFSGLPMEQLLGDGWLQRLHPDDVDPAMNIYVPAFEARRPFQMEYRFRRADETYRWVLDTGIPRYGPDGGFVGYIGSALDITERREMEQSLLDQQSALRRAFERNQDLAGRLIHAQEAERTRIARDLHDDVSQQLAGIAIMLSGLRRELGASGVRHEVQESMTVLQKQTSRLADAIRELSHELHPGVLKHAGLVPALKQYCEEIDRHHDITVDFSPDGNFTDIDFDVALCVYRVTQEALTNVVRHARARTVLVELRRAGSRIQLNVVDDGIGFVVGEGRASSLGLRSIDERVRLVGGEATIDSQPGRGTNLLVGIPIEAAAHA
jgi:PAS domain S-box-containing protein